MEKTLLITGGCGFIGSHFIDYIQDIEEVEKIINIDYLTYAAHLDNMHGYGDKVNFYAFDICNIEQTRTLFDLHEPTHIVNFAAESHVDNCISDAMPFIQTNICGTFNLLQLAKEYGCERYIQISTDEVYGDLHTCNDYEFKETDILNPSSPYSASKASADLLALSYYKTHKLPVMITRSCNNFGPRQHEEKLIPKVILNALQD